MAYMNRLGIWGPKTPFKEFSNFIQAVERRYVRRHTPQHSRFEWRYRLIFMSLILYIRGVGAMEIVAMDMKLRGMYIARQLSFTGVTFKIDEVPLSQKYVSMYNKSVKLVRGIHQYRNYVYFRCPYSELIFIFFCYFKWVRAREKFQQAANLIDAEQRMKKSMWGQFWSAHQRFFKYLCIASKVRRVVQLAREEVQNGKVRKPFQKHFTLESVSALMMEDLLWNVFCAVCGDWPAIHWWSKNTWGLGGRRRGAQWLCVNCKVLISKDDSPSPS